MVVSALATNCVLFELTSVGFLWFLVVEGQLHPSVVCTPFARYRPPSFGLIAPLN